MLFVCFKGSRHWYAYFARQIKSVSAVVHRNNRTAPTFSASLAIPALLWSSSYVSHIGVKINLRLHYKYLFVSRVV